MYIGTMFAHVIMYAIRMELLCGIVDNFVGLILCQGQEWVGGMDHVQCYQNTTVDK